MPALNNKKTASTKKSPSSVADIIVRRNHRQQKNVPMLTADKVPAGTYRSVILAVKDAVSDEGKPMADVVYRLTSSSGKVVEAKIRYPITGYHIERLFDALIDAGLPEGSPLKDAVGIEEDVTVVYPQEGALGKIKTRSPATKVVQATPQKSVPKKYPQRVIDEADEDEFPEDVSGEDFDDEFDDFLEADED